MQQSSEPRPVSCVTPLSTATSPSMLLAAYPASRTSLRRHNMPTNELMSWNEMITPPHGAPHEGESQRLLHGNVADRSVLSDDDLCPEDVRHEPHQGLEARQAVQEAVMSLKSGWWTMRSRRAMKSLASDRSMPANCPGIRQSSHILDVRAWFERSRKRSRSRKAPRVHGLCYFASAAESSPMGPMLPSAIFKRVDLLNIRRQTQPWSSSLINMTAKYWYVTTDNPIKKLGIPTAHQQTRTEKEKQQQTNALAVSNVGRHSQSARLRSLLGRAYVLKVRAVTPLSNSSTAALTPATFLFMPVCRTQYGDHTRPNPSHTASCGVPQPPPSAALHNGERAIRSWPRWLHPP